MNIYDDQTDLVQTAWRKASERERARGILIGFGLVFLSSALTLSLLAWAIG